MKGEKSLRATKAVPWEEMRAAFMVDGRLTLAAVARQFKAPLPRVYERAGAEKWIDARQELQRKNGERLVEAAREKIAAAAGKSTLTYIAELDRLGAAIAQRYLSQLDEPESVEEKSGDIMSASDAAPIGGTVTTKRRSALNLPLFARKVLEIRADFLKSLYGIGVVKKIATSVTGGSPGITMQVEKTETETKTITIGS